jgi:translocator protein
MKMDIFELKSVQITIACLLPFISAIIFGYGSNENMYPWYSTLKRPKICPPDWVFPPVWAYLYSTMGYASYRVWASGNGFEGIAKIPLIIYLIHLLLNVTWSQTFFTLHRIGAGTVHIIVLLISIIITAIAFTSVDLLAAALFLPYIAWVSLTSFVTYSFWKLNVPSLKSEKKKIK